MKNIYIFIVLLSVLSLFGCSNKESDSSLKDDKTFNTENSIFQKYDKDNSKIIENGNFSEGLCLVAYEDEPQYTYCIDLKGRIQFRIDYDFIEMHTEFHNGILFLYDINAFCDTKGNLIYPEDVGASNFYRFTYENGYIIADIIDNGIIKVGVLNTDFKWVVEPSENLYYSLCNYRGEYQLPIVSSDNYCFEHYYYIHSIKTFVNLKTGETSKYPDIDFRLPTKGYLIDDAKYKTPNHDTIIDLSDFEDDYNLSAELNSFVGNYAPVVFTTVRYNDDPTPHATYFTLIDSKGNFSFDIVKAFDGYYNGRILFDGKYILINKITDNSEHAKIYDVHGNFISEKIVEINPEQSHAFTLNNGVITEIIKYEANGYLYRSFYNPDFTLMF
ncbi:MAG: hypothetical protein IKK85_04575 [Clostridia bacterium]|nr:hypothetical protein [Clostridia bacterium]